MQDVTKFTNLFVEEYVQRMTPTKIHLIHESPINRNAASLLSWAVKEKDALIKSGHEKLLLKKESDPLVVTFFGEVIKAIRGWKEPLSEEAKKIMEKMNAMQEDYEDLDLQNYVPVVDLECNKKDNLHLMINNTTGRFVPNMTYAAWGSCLGAETQRNIKSKGRYALFRYNPKTLLPSYSGILSKTVAQEDENVNVKIYNTWTPPQWRFNEIKNAQCPPNIDKFFTHLFPDPKCRRYVFEKIHQILEDRIEVFLVANGVTGIGKGLLTEHLMMFGVGFENFIIAPISWDRSNFNAWLKNKQVVLLDETKVEINDYRGKAENVNLLKRIINERQNIEEKGQDPKQAIRSFASFFITSNNGSKNFKLEMDNRRFSVLDITDIKFVEAFSEKEQKEITYALTKCDKQRAEFFWWILQNFKEGQKYPNRLHLWKGPTYFKFKYESLTGWQQFLVTLCTGDNVKPMYTMPQINQEWEEFLKDQGLEEKSWGITREYIKNFLTEYYHMDERRIGMTERRGDSVVLIPHEKFVSKKEKIKEEKEYEEVRVEPKNLCHYPDDEDDL